MADHVLVREQNTAELQTFIFKKIENTNSKKLVPENDDSDDGWQELWCVVVMADCNTTGGTSMY